MAKIRKKHKINQYLGRFYMVFGENKVQGKAYQTKKKKNTIQRKLRRYRRDLKVKKQQ